MRKTIAAAGFLVVALAAACGGGKTGEQPGGLAAGKSVFESNCALCHGGNGKAMLAGASDLTLSKLDSAGITTVVTNGRGNMTAFGGSLSAAEIAAVTEYVKSLQSK